MNSENEHDEMMSQGADWANRFDDQANGAAEAMSRAEAAADEKERRDSAGHPGMPKPTFSTFVLSLASSALVQLGEVPDPGSGEIQEDLTMAKHGIDILAMLQEKTSKGLDPEEDRLLNGLLYELRMKFVMKK